MINANNDTSTLLDKDTVNSTAETDARLDLHHIALYLHQLVAIRTHYAINVNRTGKNNSTDTSLRQNIFEDSGCPEIDTYRRENLRNRGYNCTPGIGWHKLFLIPATWSIARRSCHQDGAHLAVINSKAEARVSIPWPTIYT